MFLIPDDGRDVAGIAGVDVFALVGLNLDEAADALALVGARIVDRVALAQLARVNAEENELADERIAPKLERERTELGIVVRERLHRLAGIGVLTLGRRNVERAGKVVHHGVDKVLNALVLEGGATGDRNKLVRDGLPANGCLEILLGDRLFLQEQHADLLVEIAHLLDEVLIGLFGQGLVTPAEYPRPRRSTRTDRCRSR